VEHLAVALGSALAQTFALSKHCAGGLLVVGVVYKVMILSVMHRWFLNSFLSVTPAAFFLFSNEPLLQWVH
jgi:hypothetical protein